MSDPAIICVPPFLTPKVLAHVKQYLQKTRNFDEQSMRKDLFEGRLQMWVACLGVDAFDAVLITRLLKETDGSKVCLLVSIGGQRMTDWLKFLKRIEEYALAEGCDRMRLEGRLGWKRLLRADYVQTGVILEKRMAVA